MNLDLWAKVQTVSVRPHLVSVLLVAEYRCYKKRISVIFTTKAELMVTHVSVLGWKAGAVALSFAADPSCGCGVTDFPCVASLAPLAGVRVGFGGSGICDT
jgi:hypothetical protein